MSALVSADSRGRVSLAKWLEPDRDYRVTQHQNGTVVLEPVTILTCREAAALGVDCGHAEVAS